ncbi:hypothetical protein J4477_02455 [Candidatus Pacearchaeota archaeon]|nr:hypothetical protein [Candidatus Pacearchaeota archaeon]
MVPIEEIPKHEILAEEIAELRNKIKNTAYDLEHGFKGNNMVKQKLETHKKMLVEKEQLLSFIIKDKDKIKEIKETEERITEKNATGISEEQQEILEEEIEKEFL